MLRGREGERDEKTTEIIGQLSNTQRVSLLIFDKNARNTSQISSSFTLELLNKKKLREYRD